MGRYKYIYMYIFNDEFVFVIFNITDSNYEDFLDTKVFNR
jgi:hypothetical protein